VDMTWERPGETEQGRGSLFETHASWKGPN